MQISLIMKQIIFNFYFQQLINTPLHKVFDMLDVSKFQSIQNIIKMDTNVLTRAAFRIASYSRLVLTWTSALVDARH